MNWKTCPLHAVISGYEFNKFAATNDGQKLSIWITHKDTDV